MCACVRVVALHFWTHPWEPVSLTFAVSLLQAQSLMQAIQLRRARQWTLLTYCLGTLQRWSRIVFAGWLQLRSVLVRVGRWVVLSHPLPTARGCLMTACRKMLKREHILHAGTNFWAYSGLISYLRWAVVIRFRCVPSPDAGIKCIFEAERMQQAVGCCVNYDCMSIERWP